jgi:hypothetical protein
MKQFRLSADDPAKVVRFVFYRDLCPNEVSTFHRQSFACRMNHKYYKEFEVEGIATPTHMVYIRAVDEANDPKTDNVFTQRERFLDIFCENFHAFHRLTEDEEIYFQAQMAKRSMKKYTRQVEMLRRENSSKWLSSVKKCIYPIKSEEYRKRCLYNLTEDIDLLFYGFESFGEKPKDAEQEEMDREILEGLLELCAKPWSAIMRLDSLKMGFRSSMDWERLGSGWGNWRSSQESSTTQLTTFVWRCLKRCLHKLV